MVDLSSIASVLKLPVRIFAALCIATGILVFAGGNILDPVGLAPLVAQYRPYLGAIFVGSLSIIVVAAFSAVASFVLRPLKERRWLRRRQKRLHDLTTDEKEILRSYIYEQTRSTTLPVQSGVVGALVAEQIISRGSNVGTIYGFAYVIQPWAWSYLNTHPDLLE
jgi:hypothetical protein